jgi:hypothetical protein
LPLGDPLHSIGENRASGVDETSLEDVRGVEDVRGEG